MFGLGCNAKNDVPAVPGVTVAPSSRVGMDSIDICTSGSPREREVGLRTVSEMRAVMALSGSDGAAMAAGLCQVRADFESAKAPAPGGTTLGRQISELVRSLICFLESHIAPTYAKYAAAEALKEVLLWLARCSSSVEEGRECCKRLVLLLFGDEAGAGGIWCGRVLEELLRTLKSWQQESDKEGGRVGRLRLMLRDAVTSMPGGLARYLSEHRLLSWLRTDVAVATDDALERDAATLAFSILHRGIRCNLICCGDGEDAADTVRMISHVAALCLGLPAHTSDEGGTTGLACGGERGHVEEGWGCGFGWGCLRRKCVAVLLACDLRECSPFSCPAHVALHVPYTAFPSCRACVQEGLG